jgi:ankyrin repeat protein
MLKSCPVRSDSSLQSAIQANDIARVKVLLTDSRVDPAADDNEAIQCASHMGHVEVVKALLADPRVDPAADNNGAIYWASRCGHLGVVKSLLTNPRVDPTKARLDHADIVEAVAVYGGVFVPGHASSAWNVVAALFV